MSLIFRALQRVGDQASVKQQTSQETVLKSKRKSLSLKDLLLSNISVMVAAICIFLAGVLISQSVQLFPNHIKAHPPLAEAAPDEKTATVALIDPEPAAGKVVYSESDQPDPEIVKQDVTYQVLLPEQQTSMESRVLSEKKRFPIVPAEPAGGEKTTAPNSLPDSSSFADAVITNDSDSEVTEKKPASNEMGSREMKTAIHQIPALSMVLPNTGSAQLPQKSSHYKTLPKDDRSTESSTFEQHRKLSAQATRHLEISRLANKIHSAIQAEDTARASQLIKELSKLKGSKNNFVLKLKAYSMIRQDRYTDARTLLNQVLSHRADDLEAGLNMAVVDIRTGNYHDARRRLVHLQALYPEEDSVTQCLKQLPRSP